MLYPKLAHITSSTVYNEGATLIAGYFKGTLGQGIGAELYYRDLQQQGVEVYAIDICTPFPNIEDRECTLPLCTLENAPRHGTMIMHCNAPEMGRALQYLGKELTSHRKIIGYWAWELEVTPRSWHRAYDYCDEVWVPSHFTAKAFQKAPIPIKVVPHIVQSVMDAGLTLQDLGLEEICAQATCFLVIADCRSDLIRKNVYGSVQAFLLGAKNNKNAALILKMHHTEFGGKELQRIKTLAAHHENIHFVDRLFSESEYGSLMHRCDALISLHRTEGYGLHLAEALRIGKKVIATNYSGNVDFMSTDHSANCILVPYKLVPVSSENPNYKTYKDARWADADVQYAAGAIKKILNMERD